MSVPNRVTRSTVPTEITPPIGTAGYQNSTAGHITSGSATGSTATIRSDSDTPMPSSGIR